MVQAYLMVVALLGAMAGINLGMVASHVQADSGQCPCGDAPGRGYACNNCNSYHQQGMAQGQVQQVGEWCKHYDFSDTTTCGYFRGYSHVQSEQPVFQQVNCFWSYPVQCNNGVQGSTVAKSAIMAV